MEGLFVAVLLGCSDAGTQCEPVAERELEASSPDQCSALALSNDEALRIDYPVVVAVCRAMTEDPLFATAKRG